MKIEDWFFCSRWLLDCLHWYELWNLNPIVVLWTKQADTDVLLNLNQEEWFFWGLKICGDFQFKRINEEKQGAIKMKWKSAIIAVNKTILQLAKFYIKTAIKGPEFKHIQGKMHNTELLREWLKVR